MSTRARPTTIVAMLARLVWLRPRFALATAAAVLLGVIVIAGSPGCASPRVRVATFNIRNFPEHPRQIEGAFEAIEGLDVPVIAVQEINDPVAFQTAARHLLGSHWRAEFGPAPAADELANRPLLPGLLFDQRHYEFDYARRHAHTQIDGQGRPTLEVRLEGRRRNHSLRVFVVHLKAGGEHARTRRRQVRALEPIVLAAVEGGGEDEVVVLGDFNATGPEDRETLADFRRVTGLHWASEELACTAYWRPQGKCRGSALDHVFTSRPQRAVAARGPCEQVGCEPGDSCPVFYDEVSDHCPVSAEF